MGESSKALAQHQNHRVRKLTLGSVSSVRESTWQKSVSNHPHSNPIRNQALAIQDKIVAQAATVTRRRLYYQVDDRTSATPGDTLRFPGVNYARSLSLRFASLLTGSSHFRLVCREDRLIRSVESTLSPRPARIHRSKTQRLPAVHA